MNRNNQPWGALPPAHIDWDPSGAPRSSQFDDVYYSRDDGPAESRHVFLAGNALPERWEANPRASFCIAETGFGTGLNFLLAWDAWARAAAPEGRLHYVAVERYPLSPADLQQALARHPELAERARGLQACYPPLLPGQHRLQFDGGRVTLDLWFEDVVDSLQDLSASSPGTVDAWFLDGFAPARNEGMWQAAVYQAMGALSRPGATVATFTAAGHVRRGLADAGFAMEKVPGFGRKRECLRGSFSQVAAPPLPSGTPWDLVEKRAGRPSTALVLGAGLAGCATAAALSARGVDVTLLEQANMASGGSGNAQGILYTRLSHRHASLTDFAVHSFLFASRHYSELFAQDRLERGRDGDLCGNFQQVQDEDRLERLRLPLASLPELAELLTPEVASERLGVNQPHPGIWYPGSGWMNPPAVCRALLDKARIALREHCGELTLHADTSGWHAIVGGQSVASAECAVIATGAHPLPMALDWLPRQTIRGQTSDIASQGSLAALKACLCHEGYIAPAREGRHTIGATFILDTLETGEREEEHAENLEKLAAAMPDLATDLPLASQVLSGRVGFRCASSDYLPIVGPLPERESFLQTFAALGKNARSPIASKGPYVPGLFLNIAHGSRGLTTTPLSAELLAAQICGEPLPLARELARALAPARFLVRELVRGPGKL